MRKYILLALTVSPLLAFAEKITFDTPVPGVGLDAQDFIKLLLQISLWVVLPAIALVIIYSGFQMVSAQGDMTKIKKEKTRLLGAVIGLAIVFASNFIIDIVFNTGNKILNP